jgi:hypothetical protein
MQIRRALVLLPLILALACFPGGGGDNAQPQPAAGGSDGAAAGDDDQGDDDQGDDGAGEDSDTVTAEPSVEIEGDCEEQPQGKAGKQTLNAQLDVVNTGNVGVIVRVGTRWPLKGRAAVVSWHRLQVEQGETKPLTVRTAVPDELADSVRAAVDNGRTCKFRSRVKGAFGMPEDG